MHTSDANTVMPAQGEAASPSAAPARRGAARRGGPLHELLPGRGVPESRHHVDEVRNELVLQDPGRGAATPNHNGDAIPRADGQDSSSGDTGEIVRWWVPDGWPSVGD